MLLAARDDDVAGEVKLWYFPFLDFWRARGSVATGRDGGCDASRCHLLAFTISVFPVAIVTSSLSLSLSDFTGVLLVAEALSCRPPPPNEKKSSPLFMRVPSYSLACYHYTLLHIGC